MKKLFSILLLSLCMTAFAQRNDDVEYTDGSFFVNEDWYGHQNSTVNFLSTAGEWSYRIFQKANPGKELGCTSQYGTIYGGRFYIVSKQEKDPGASVVGSRLAVCDAKTMKCLKEHQTIATNAEGESIADGRSFLGVNETKGYIGTSNGIWVYNMETGEIGGQIEGTGNPNASGYGQLYHAQIGTMIRTEDYVFAIHQQDGLKIIDPESDKLIKTIAPPVYEKNGRSTQSGFGSIVQSKDGNLWISMAANTSGNGGTLPFVLKMDPVSFEADTIQIPNDAGIEDIPNSWYAWTVDGFCASTQENKIYWAGNNGNSWFKGRRIFSYDIDKQEFAKTYDFEEMPGNWILYGAGFRIHPVSDELYCSIFHEFQDPTYEAVRIGNTGELLAEYPMITNYWFPAMPVFPDIHLPELSEIGDIEVEKNGSKSIDLNEYVSDADNMNVSIVKSIVKNTAAHVISSKIQKGILTIEALDNQEAIAYLRIRFNSNGHLAEKKVKVIVGQGGTEYPDDDDTSIDPIATNDCKIYYAANTLHVENAASYQLAIYNMNGVLLRTAQITNDKFEIGLYLARGHYIVHARRAGKSFSQKISVNN